MVEKVEEKVREKVAKKARNSSARKKSSANFDQCTVVLLILYRTFRESYTPE